MELPNRIHTAFEVLSLTQQVSGGIFTADGKEIVPPRSLSPREAHLREVALHTLAGYIRGSIPLEDPPNVVQVQPAGFHTLITDRGQGGSPDDSAL